MAVFNRLLGISEMQRNSMTLQDFHSSIIAGANRNERAIMIAEIMKISIKLPA